MNSVSRHTPDAVAARIRKRYVAERNFRLLGLGAVVFSALVLAFLLISMTSAGVNGFRRAEVSFLLDLSASQFPIDARQVAQADAMAQLEAAGLPTLVSDAATDALGADGAAQIDSSAWREVAERIADDPSLIGSRIAVSLPVTGDLASGLRGGDSAEMQALAARLKRGGTLRWAWDPGFLSRSDATDPQAAGIWAALKGSMLTMLVTLLMAFPLGVLSAVYLEEYAPRNRWTEWIEISINNLAAVPSIIFGLLGLAVFLAIFPNFRSAPLIGGMTLALMTMPVIVISARNAIKAVPPSIRDGALAIGASRIQVVFHHVLPLALPGILTGTIIGMARALGETAPLLMIGMRAFVATPPAGFTSPSSVLPVQIFLWSDEIDRGFVARTSAAIIVLLVFLLVMNGVAIYLRNRFERRW